MPRKLQLTRGFYLYLAAALLMVPLRWLFASAAAATVHELAHLAAVRLLGYPVCRVRIGILGCRIETVDMPGHHELICALAGPVGGLCLLCLTGWQSEVGICAAIQSVYNLLPVSSADGGRALRCAAGSLLPPRATFILCYAAEIAVVSALTALGIWCSIALNLGLLPLAAAAIPLYRTVKQK